VSCILFTFRISFLIAFVNFEFFDNTAVAARFTTSDFSDLDADLKSSRKPLIVIIVSLVNTAEGMLEMGYLLKVMRKFTERVTYRFEKESQWANAFGAPRFDPGRNHYASSLRRRNSITSHSLVFWPMNLCYCSGDRPRQTRLGLCEHFSLTR
jgi:hypothetical protein